MNRPLQPGTPGASAQHRADQLRSEELRFQHRRARAWLLPALLLWVAIYMAADSLLPNVLAVVAGLIAPYVIFKRLYQPGEEVQRWRAGASGERRTAKHLNPLLRRGWVILHDRAIHGSRANLDHLVLTPDGQGALYVDTKTTRGGGAVSFRGNTLVIGRTPYPDAIKTVLWETEQASRALHVPVQPVIALHGARVQGGRMQHSSGLVVVAAPLLRHQISSIPHQPSPHVLTDLAHTAERTLPAYPLVQNPSPTPTRNRSTR